MPGLQGRPPQRLRPGQGRLGGQGLPRLRRHGPVQRGDEFLRNLVQRHCRVSISKSWKVCLSSHFVCSDAAFVEKASGSPTEVMKAFAKEVYQNFKSDQIDDATKINAKASFRSSKNKLNPIGLLSSQNSDSFHSEDPTDVRVEGINRLTRTDSCSSIEFVQVDSDSSVASYKPPLSRSVNFNDIMTVDSESSSRGNINYGLCLLTPDCLFFSI